ncbi:MAG: LacI family DNA-binding transcriptional regulator [Candidatus Omnitrophica bacterium]|nr:LacI family DNA-binding transcriptional regulator [Candidatus Omnitrophota bacterium]
MGAKKISIEDVAHSAGVSITTVSRVLNGVGTVTEANRRKVLDVIRKLKYRPNPSAQRLAAGRTNTVGLLIPRFEGIFQSYYAVEVIKGIGMAAEKAGCDLLLHITDGHSSINPSAVDGILFMDVDGNSELVDEAFQEGVPCIILNHFMEDLPVGCVAIDNRNAAKLVVDYLAGLGHREIGTITGDLNTQAGLDRLDGFVQAMKAKELPIKDGYVQYGHFRPDVARQCTEALLGLSDRPTALFVASDEMAIEVVSVALAKGVRVPEDLSVVGFDDNPIARHGRVPLTTVRQPLGDMGRISMELLMDQIRGKGKSPLKRLLTTELVERQSCRQTWLER